MADNFDTVVEWVKQDEGGFSKDPQDPGNWTGGKVGVGVLKGTKYGIAANTYPHLDIEHLTWPEAKQIYHRDYWQATRADQMPNSFAYLFMDGCINSGAGNAAKWLQAAVRTTVDGKLGPKTLGAMQAMDPHDVVLRFIAARLDFLNDLAKWDRYGRGWSQRIVEILNRAAEIN